MCFICNHNAQTLKIDGYLRCNHCKTHIANVLPDNRKAQNVIEEHACSYILHDDESLDFRTEIIRLAVLKNFSKSAQTILDYGCGNGKFIKFLLNKRFKAFGYDKSENIKKYLFAHNIPFYKSVEGIPDNYFDVMTCFDVIEHTTNPRFFIRTMKKKLKKNGILIICTPNSQGLSAMILGKKWWVFGPTAHFILFSTYSLKLLLKEMDFKILDMSTDTLTPWFTPPEKFLHRILNKLLYLLFHPFQRLLFANSLGDNIQYVARLSD